MVCKTLVVKAAGNTYWLVITSGDRELSLKSLPTVTGSRQLEMAPTADAEKVTGYKVGGISPFAQRRRLSVVVGLDNIPLRDELELESRL